LTATVVEGGRWWWIIGEGVFWIADLFLLHPQLNGILLNKEIQYKSRMISATCISDSDHFEEDFLCFFNIVNWIESEEPHSLTMLMMNWILIKTCVVLNEWRKKKERKKCEWVWR
jgi:hypothetical protein